MEGTARAGGIARQDRGLEGGQAELTAAGRSAIYQTDPPAAQKAAERLAAIDDELMALPERWEALESRAGWLAEAAGGAQNQGVLPVRFAGGHRLQPEALATLPVWR